MTQHPLNWQKIREKLAQSQGPAYWRSLAELAEITEFTDWVAREFPGGTAGRTADVDQIFEEV